MRLDDTKKLFIGQIAVGLCSLIATVFIARYVGPAMFGFCASSILIASVILDLIDFGSCSWSARELANGGISKRQYLEIMRKQTRKALLITTLAPFLILFSPSNFEMVFLFLFYPALWLRTNYIQQFLIVHERIKEAISLQLLERLFWLIYIMASVLEVDKITIFVIPILLGLLVHGLLGTKLIMNEKESSGEGFNDTENTDNNFSNLKNFGLISVISNIGNLDGAVVATASTLAESGNYNLAVRFRNPIQLSFQVFSARLRPVAARKNKIEIATLFRSNQTFLVYGILGIIVLSAFAYKAATVLFGDSFVGLNLVLSMGLLCSIPNGISVICASFLISAGFEDFIAKASLNYVFASLTGIGIAAYFFGSFGAIFFSLMTGILLSMILVKKSLKEFSILI